MLCGVFCGNFQAHNWSNRTQPCYKVVCRNIVLLIFSDTCNFLHHICGVTRMKLVKWNPKVWMFLETKWTVLLQKDLCWISKHEMIRERKRFLPRRSKKGKTGGGRATFLTPCPFSIDQKSHSYWKRPIQWMNANFQCYPTTLPKCSQHRLGRPCNGVLLTFGSMLCTER